MKSQGNQRQINSDYYYFFGNYAVIDHTHSTHIEGEYYADRNAGHEKYEIRRESKLELPEIARTRGLAMPPPPRPNFPALFHMPLHLATLIDITTFCFVPSIAASHARRSSSSSALDFAIPLGLE